MKNRSPKWEQRRKNRNVGEPRSAPSRYGKTYRAERRAAIHGTGHSGMCHETPEPAIWGGHLYSNKHDPVEKMRPVQRKGKNYDAREKEKAQARKEAHIAKDVS